MIIAISFILLILTFFLYLRESGTKGNYWLLVLRLLVVLLLGWIGVGKVLTLQWNRQPRRVVFLVDRSQSMEMAGVDTVVDQVLTLLQERIKGVKQEVWWFGDTAIKSGQRDEVVKLGKERTRLGKALEVVGQTNPGAIVLLSDGQDNGERAVIPVVQRLTAPVYAVGFGAKGGRNLTIEELELPAVVYARDTFRIRVRLASSGFANQERCRLRLDGQTKEVPLGAAWSEQDVFFQMVFTESGRKTVQVIGESLPGELSYQDNRRSGSVEVKPARLAIFYITNHPGPQTRFIRRALEKDPRLDVKAAIKVTGGFSSERRALDSADVFIVDGAEEMPRDKEFWSALRERVEKGAGVLVLAGDAFQAGEQLERLLPVKGGKLMRGEWTPASTEPGLFLPWLRENGVNLSSVPPFNSIWMGTVEDERATVWMTAQENQAPILVAGRTGKGKVVYLAAYPLWRWGFLADAPPDKLTPLDIFLSGIVRYLSEKDTGQFIIETDALSYLTGERITLTLQAQRPDATPWEGLDARAVVKDSGGGSFDVPMQETGFGRYKTEIDGLAPGRYFVYIEVREQDRLMSKAGPVEFRVTEESVEMTQLGLNQDLMSRIALLSGGWFVKAESIDEVDTLEFQLGVYHKRFSVDPRRSLIIYGLLAALFGTEIVLRRQRGLL